MSFTIILLLIFAVIEMFHASRRGIVRQIIHVVFTAAAFVIAFMAVDGLVGTELFTAETVDSFIAELQAQSGEVQIDEAAIESIKNLNPDVMNALLALPMATLVAPMAFSLVFVVVYAVAQILFFIISRIFPKVDGVVGKGGGMVVGLVEAVLAFSLVMLPMAVITDIGLEVNEKIDLSSFVDEESFEGEEIPEDIMVVENDFVLDISRALGSGILDSFYNTTINGHDYNMREELSNLIDVIDAVGGVGADFNPEDLSDEAKAAISGAIDEIGNSDYLSYISSGMFAILGTSIEDLELESDEGGDLYLAIIKDLVRICATSDETTIKGDLNTVKDVFFILSDDGIIAAFNANVNSDEMLTLLTTKDAEGNTTIDEIITALRANDRTAPLITTLTKLSISIMAENLGLDADTAEIYENVKTGVNEILEIDRDSYASDEEYKDAVAESINSTLTENGITLNDDAIDAMADYAAENFSDVEQLTDDDINDILLKYYNAYTK